MVLGCPDRILQSTGYGWSGGRPRKVLGYPDRTTGCGWGVGHPRMVLGCPDSLLGFCGQYWTALPGMCHFWHNEHYGHYRNTIVYLCQMWHNVFSI